MVCGQQVADMDEKRARPPRFSTPVWAPRRGSYGNNHWINFSPKLDRRVCLYSDLEYYHWLLVEGTPEIETYCEQPLEMRSSILGRDAKSIIDMWVRFRDGTEEYREVKYKKDLTEEGGRQRVVRQLGVQQAWCSRHQVCHVVVNEAMILANPLFLENWRAIITHLTIHRGLTTSSIEPSIRRLLAASGPTSISELTKQFVGPSPLQIHTAAFRLLHRGAVSAPLATQPLSYRIALRCHQYG